MLYKNRDVATYPPFGGDSRYKVIRLANTGTTESSNSRALAHNQMHVLVTGSAAVRVSFRGEGGLSGAVSQQDLRIPAETFFYFVAQKDGGDGGSTFVYVEEDLGSSGYEVFLYQASR